MALVITFYLRYDIFLKTSKVIDELYFRYLKKGGKAEYDQC